MLAPTFDSEAVNSAVLTAGGRILIVDDDERQRTALSAMLADCDYDMQVAADGQEALERLTAFNADVIVSDLVMPRMDGFELLRHLKDRGDPTPAIALTGFGSMEKALSAVHELKAFWHLEKPVEPRAFKTRPALTASIASLRAGGSWVSAQQIATAAGSPTVAESQGLEGSERCQSKAGEWTRAQQRAKIRRNPGQLTLQRRRPQGAQ